ncbi:hypothetical protein GV791_12000 [Nocardia cyriacigeorgica]|uniref:DNA recombination-mediator protein A n=1 Tax=Nocardia cyriacigeorgica TaxID=135487 RepID=A0A6P1CPY0_9NOCA|nr:hypothetical protein [Nocardia cyriacigeorgica]NEW33276.1 hypothetical protein [Nocardia cyriacigeorgica]BDU04683.1 hypothetical protein FMUBM48_09460 [Nocardia cyriacigeorgica]
MTTIGITGHSNLSEATQMFVADELRVVLRPYAGTGLVGITCLARGADQIFAQIVLELGGAIEVVIPAADYVSGIRQPADRKRVDDFIANARAVHELPFLMSGPESYLAASKELINRSDLLVAVWDGSPPDGRGGTADAVTYAKRIGRNVAVVWPENSERG